VLSAPAGSEAKAPPESCFQKRVAIFGPGLIGGSIAMGLRARSLETKITIWGRNLDQLEKIMQCGLADRVTHDPATAVQEADLIILCTPVEIMPELARAIAPHLTTQSVVTDAGSVKASVTKELTALLGNRFVGGHPMAGSELSGLAAARANLFAGAPCILTPLVTTHPEALETVTCFWNFLGSFITTMSPEEHDRLVARLSHLPHALAFALVHLVASTLPTGSALLAGGSFRDATRVAASSPALWAGILTENRQEVIAALREMSTLLDSLAKNLAEKKTPMLLDFLTQAQKHRDNLPPQQHNKNSDLS
jgi:prephenate dehydrogenase